MATIEGKSTFSNTSGDTLAASGYTCDTAEGLACDDMSGACVVLPKIGEMCLSGFNPCVTEAYCAAGTCKAKSEAGFPCDSSSACVDGNYCDMDSKLCAASLAAGAACTSSMQCASSSCTNGKCSDSNDFSLTFLCGTN
ncbi:MAG TPA: Dickkopf N-terminal cysteine-rich domain-containing protein [Polyangiaceae bacterium]|nr:Dickkopf N-terminal cysteine-rich domain-containing protein [Polyangiaceae bacterium]